VSGIDTGAELVEDLVMANRILASSACSMHSAT
jgi:hypothetical protein